MNFGKGPFEIINSGYVTGCTDRAIVYSVPARENGIPTRYVETFKKDLLIDPDLACIKGHVFVDIYLDGVWNPYEPIKGFTRDGKYILGGDKYIVVG